MARLMLLECTPASFRPEPRDVVVGLTPEACYELDRQSIPYRLSSDFDLDAKLAALEPRHWQEQLRWIEALDDVVAKHVLATRSWRFGAATLYAFHLKMLMDPVRVKALELAAMLESCDRVVLHRRLELEPPTSRVGSSEVRSVTSRILPIIAGAGGLEWEERLVEVQAGDARPVASAPPSAQLGRVKTWRRRAYHRLRTEHLPLGTTPDRCLTLLFADFGYDLRELLTRARSGGHRCLRLMEDSVVEDGRRTVEIVRLPEGGGVVPDWTSAAEAVSAPDHPIWAWPNSWVPEASLADVLRPTIVDWLDRLMPHVAARATVFAELLTSEHIDFVIAANLVNLDVLAAAAVTKPPAQSVLIDHGHRAHAPELFDLILLRHVDHNFSATSELARYMESRRPLYECATAEPHVGSYQWRQATSSSRSKRPPEEVPGGKPVVVYTLTATSGNALYLNSSWYSDAWYYRLCREIVDVLARHPEVHSVVKLFPGDGNLRNPIDLYVRDLNRDHLVSSRAPLRDWIPWADRIVFDYPSTGLYEAAVAGVPYLALLYAHHSYRPEAVTKLGSAAVSFTEPGEAAMAVETFVSSRTVTAPRLAPEGDEILVTLERLAEPLPLRLPR